MGCWRVPENPQNGQDGPRCAQGRKISARRIPKINPSGIFGGIPPKKCAAEALQGRFDQADDLQSPPPRVRNAPTQ